MQHTCKRWVFCWIVALSVELGIVNSLNAQSLTWLGVPFGVSSVAVAVSDNGKVVVGRAGDILNGPLAADVYIWDLSTNRVLRLTEGGGSAFGLTPDGVKVGGQNNLSSFARTAFIWTEASGRVQLPQSGSRSWVICLTPDGSRAGGASGYPNYPAIWDVASVPPQLLRVYSDRGYGGEIWDFSDAADIALCFIYSGGTYRARIWYMNGLDIQQDIVLAPFASDPYTLGAHLSPDGTIAVGMSGQIYDIWLGVGSNYRPVMWRAGNNWQVEPLATLGGSRGFAWDINAGVIVGFCSLPNDENRAVRWNINTATTQVEDLNVTYANLLGDGSRLRIAYGVSRNGRFIVGSGYNAATGRSEAFLLDTMVTITGNVELRDFTGDVTQIPVTVELRQGGNVVGSRTLNLDSSGNYAFATYPGTYDLAFKASHWLRTVVPNVSVSGSSVTVNVSLTNGDIDGDNEVTLFDFGGLVAAFGSVPGDSNWNPDADLDGDEEVTLFDFGILVRNFGAIGDE